MSKLSLHLLHPCRDSVGLSRLRFRGMVQKMTQQEELIKELEEKLAVLDQESGKVRPWFR